MIRRDADNVVPPAPDSVVAPPAEAEVVSAPTATPPPPERATPARPDGPSKVQQIGGVVAQLAIALVVLGVGLGLTYLLIQTKSAPAKLQAARAAPVVVVAEVKNTTQDATVRGYGTVRAASELRVVPQVGGRITSLHPQLVAGGELPAGAVVMTLDSTDFDIALEQASADLERAQAALTRIDARRRAAAAEVARAETSLETMRAEADIARREFERLRPGEPVPPLVGKQPQLRREEAAVEAAKAQLDDVNAEELELQARERQAAAAVRQAEVALERTRVVLPEGTGRTFRVLSEDVDVGQFVAAGSPVATVYAAESLEVPVPLDDRQLRWISVGGDNASSAVATLGNSDETFEGQVDRTEGQIDVRTRLTQVVIALDVEGDRRRLVPGTFLDVTIEGKPIENVAAIPRRALRTTEAGESAVHVAEAADGEASSLATRPVIVVRRAGDTVFVEGLADGERVILTRLDVVSDGMTVQVGEVVGEVVNEVQQ